MMRTSTKVIRLCAVVPASLAGSFVAVMSLGFLPDAGLVAAFVATLLASIVLACGLWEPQAARVLGFARGLRAGEQAQLAHTLALLEVLELEPGRVLMRLTDTGGLPATPIGRRTVIIEPTLIQGLYERRLTNEDAAAAIGHAVASQRVGPARFDLAARLWAFPWTLLYVAIRQIARAFSWVPAAGFAWHMRIVIGVIVVVQGFQPGGDPALGIATGSLIAISYIAPAADRAWRRRVQRDADRIVALAGLAGSMVHYAQWQDGASSLERVHRINAAADERQRRKQAVHHHPRVTDRGPGGALVLAHPTALR
ncbi:hypothetical protein [Nocardioides sp. KR10-350]|uniref:hypothetical protein n=1 Tax=Nocardioides cheoyonin TaxID=3156615 RepID=UPI0032B421E2